LRHGSPKKNKSVADFLFFFGFVTLSVVIFISMVTLKNECILLRNEIYRRENIKTTHLDRVKVLAGKVKNLSRQDRIEKLAYENFQLYVPAPESLIVYVGDVE
jgi:cell division protein FtsL